MSDVGNIYAATHGLEPGAPYANGQFSNGPVWAQDLSHSLGLGALSASLLGGTDYAFGGATTGYAGTTTSGSSIPTVSQQVGGFLAAHGSVAPSSALYSIWIGSNDIFNIITGGVTGTAAVIDAQGAAQAEATAIKSLAAAGAKDFLVPLVTNLGKTPTLTSVSLAASAAGTALSQAYDAALVADLAALASTPGIALSYLDTFSLLDSAIATPAAYGLKNVINPCYTGPYTGVGGTVCATPNSYLFWDQLHPTATGQAIIATAAFDTVPEPAAIAILASGLAGMAALRFRPRAARHNGPR